jgi:ferric-dicitrate binding protein FerR (iron transport regulator)
MNSAESYFEDLLMRVIEGCASEEEFATFSEIIRLDAELRRRYVREMRLHALLSCQGEEKSLGKTGLKHENPKRVSVQMNSGCRETEAARRRRPSGWWKMAAAVALLLSGAAVWHKADINRVREKLGAAVEDAAESVVPVVRLVSQKNVKGLDLPESLPGTLRLESGEIVVRLQTGVELTLIGPASVVVQNGIRVDLESGFLLANVPHWATGFTVRTMNLEVYDLGTVFSVNVAAGKSDVFVFKGSVQVNEAGSSEWGRETSGAGVGICEAGEGVRAVSESIPSKIVADWPEAKRLFGAVQARRALDNPTKTLETAIRIADLWEERNLPGSNLAVKKAREGNGIPFQKTAWVRTSVPQQEESDMKKSSVAAIMAAAAVMMGAGTSGATSAPIQIDTSPGFSWHWRTVFTNDVFLKWNWNTAATHAELAIAGMNGSFTTNFTSATSNYQWKIFTTSLPSAEEVHELRVTFYSGSDVVVGALTSRLAVVTSAFGRTAIIPTPAARGWATVRDNVVIPYDAGWAAATADATHSQLVIAKASGMTQTNVLSDAAGYYGWKLKHSDWGFGTFNLALTFPGAEGEWDATVTRVPDGTMIRVR